MGLTARNLLLAGRSRKPGFGGIHGGERGLIEKMKANFYEDLQVRMETFFKKEATQS